MGTRKQLNFSVEENKRLFEIWGKPSIVRGAMPHNKDAAIPYLAKISNAMAIKGCPRSVEDIQKRINYLVTSHKRLRNKQDSGKAFNISWEFYDPVQEIMDYAASLDEQEELKKDEVEKNPAEKGEDEDEDDDDTSESSSNSSISQKSYQPLTSGEAIES